VGSNEVGDAQVDDDEPEKHPLGFAADSGSLKTDDESIVASIPLDSRLLTFPSTTTALMTVTGASRGRGPGAPPPPLTPPTPPTTPLESCKSAVRDGAGG